MSAQNQKIRINRRDYHRMLQHVEELLPFEACGLLAGIGGVSVNVYPVTNVLNSPVRFFMEPQEQLSAFLDIEQKDWQLLAIYHSHPNGPAQPSATDTREYFYPDTPCLIWSKREGRWICQAFSIQERQVFPLIVEIVE